MPANSSSDCGTSAEEEAAIQLLYEVVQQNLTPEMQVISVNKTTDNTKIDQYDSFLSPLMDLSILNRMD